jgi:hypothetical protein
VCYTQRYHRSRSGLRGRARWFGFPSKSCRRVSTAYPRAATRESLKGSQRIHSVHLTHRLPARTRESDDEQPSGRPRRPPGADVPPVGLPPRTRATNGGRALSSAPPKTPSCRGGDFPQSSALANLYARTVSQVTQHTSRFSAR